MDAPIKSEHDGGFGRYPRCFTAVIPRLVRGLHAAGLPALWIEALCKPQGGCPGQAGA
jgi:hypothetical protein